MTRPFVAAAILMLLSPPAGAQTNMRPSIEHGVTAICLKADVEGDSYRPYVCDPHCEHLSDEIATLDASHTCKEPSPGDFDVRSETLIDLYCQGECSATGFPCTSDSSCPGNICATVFNECSITGDECFSDLNCPVVENHCEADSFFGGGYCAWSNSCSSSDDCPQGWTCSGGVCRGVLPECNPPSGLLPSLVLCASVPQPPVLQLEGVSEDVTTPTAVTVTRPDASTVPINHGDAQECLSQIEAATGEPCSSGL